MKRIFLLLSILTSLVMLTACGKGANNPIVNKDQTSTTPEPSITIAEDKADKDQEDTETEKTGGLEDTLIGKDFYPLKADTEYVYEGSGNEYASFTTYVDYIDSEKDKLQTRTNNGGTETVKVLEYKDGKLYITKTVHECYYRDNFLEQSKDEESEILLMEPLIPGTSWTLSDGRKRFISASDVMIDTPTGKYNAIEVTTESEDSVIKDYYAKNVGLVKTLFLYGDYEVSSILSDIRKNVPHNRDIMIYYPDSDGNIYPEPVTLSFYTNDITREVISEALKAEAPKPSYLPLISSNTVIHSLYLGKDGIVYLDLSSDFIKDMNAGAGFEQMILQSITNTLGMYYGVEELYLTLDSKPYESGHISMKKGETLKVNMEQVITE